MVRGVSAHCMQWAICKVACLVGVHFAFDSYICLTINTAAFHTAWHPRRCIMLPMHGQEHRRTCPHVDVCSGCARRSSLQQIRPAPATTAAAVAQLLTETGVPVLSTSSPLSQLWRWSLALQLPSVLPLASRCCSQGPLTHILPKDNVYSGCGPDVAVRHTTCGHLLPLLCPQVLVPMLLVLPELTGPTVI